MPYQSVGFFLVDVMMKQFDLSNWNYDDDLDLYESIDLIKDYYDIMTDRLRREILDASPHAGIQRQVGIIKKVKCNQKPISLQVAGSANYHGVRWMLGFA
jgi:hypothetical protein